MSNKKFLEEINYDNEVNKIIAMIHNLSNNKFLIGSKNEKIKKILKQINDEIELDVIAGFIKK